MNRAHAMSTRWSLVLGGLVALATMFIGVAGSADAQEVDCERVTYNERIIIVCNSDGTDDQGSTESDDSSSSDSTESNDGDSADDPDDAGADDQDNGEASSSDDEADSRAEDGDAGTSTVDRGGRGSRTIGADSDLDPPASETDTEAEVVASDAGGDGDAATGDAATGDAESTDAPDGSDQGASDNQASDDGNSATADPNDALSELGAGPVLGPLPVDPPPDSLPIIVGLAGLVGCGAAFLLAARRNQRAEPPTSSGDQRTPR